ncbi:MAG: class I SAM-dependent methyltransferase [Betaproteobacteria bacterium]|nr:class I SAM-dependent methyltransferase [Betaproteobacteria bacterium]
MSTLSVSSIRSDDFKEAQREAYARDVARLLLHSHDFVEVDCPACRSKRRISAFSKYACQFVNCLDCQTIYMSPRPTPALMDDYYSNSENYRIWKEHIFPASEPARRDHIARPNLDRVIAACQAAGLALPHLVEIGPGFGTFSQLAQQSGFFGSVEVIERNPDMASECLARGLKVHQMALEDFTADHAGRFDVAVCYEVIEHIFDASLFLQTLRSLLRPGGLFILTCPNGLGYDTQMLGPLSPAVDTEHVNLFNPHAMRVLLQSNGFERVNCETPGRLDADIVRRAVLAGETQLDATSLDHHVLVANFATLGAAFQQFIASHGLSGNMHACATRTA